MSSQFWMAASTMMAIQIMMGMGWISCAKEGRGAAYKVGHRAAGGQVSQRLPAGHGCDAGSSRAAAALRRPRPDVPRPQRGGCSGHVRLRNQAAGAPAAPLGYALRVLRSPGRHPAARGAAGGAKGCAARQGAHQLEEDEPLGHALLLQLVPAMLGEQRLRLCGGRAPGGGVSQGGGSRACGLSAPSRRLRPRGAVRGRATACRGRPLRIGRRRAAPLGARGNCRRLARERAGSSSGHLPAVVRPSEGLNSGLGCTALSNSPSWSWSAILLGSVSALPVRSGPAMSWRRPGALMGARAGGVDVRGAA
jgi:hypothetical protein